MDKTILFGKMPDDCLGKLDGGNWVFVVPDPDETTGIYIYIYDELSEDGLRWDSWFESIEEMDAALEVTYNLKRSDLREWDGPFEP